jgi:hypothetical protein
MQRGIKKHTQEQKAAAQLIKAQKELQSGGKSVLRF